MEKATHAKISNNAPFLVSILENARKTHMGIFSVFSITVVFRFSQNRTFAQIKTATRRPPLGVTMKKTYCDGNSVSPSTIRLYLLFEEPSIVETTYSN